MPLHVDDATVEALVEPAAAERVVWSAFAAWGRGTAATTMRVRAGAAGSMVSAMAAVVPPYLGGKLYATKDGRFTFVNVLFDTEGRVLGTLDGDTITRLRTPAAASLAIRHLAVERPAVAALVGTGRQAWPHVRMLGAALIDLTELRVAGRSPAAVEHLAARAQAAGIPVVVADDPAAAVDGAQVVVTVTSSPVPLFPASVVGDDTLICAVGATERDSCEIGPDVVARCPSVVCDDVEGSMIECGDLIRAHAEGRFDWSIAVELHAVAARNVTVARAGTAPALFETQGVALQDVAVAGLAYGASAPLTPPPRSTSRRSNRDRVPSPVLGGS